MSIGCGAGVAHGELMIMRSASSDPNRAHRACSAIMPSSMGHTSTCGCDEHTGGVRRAGGRAGEVFAQLCRSDGYGGGRMGSARDEWAGMGHVPAAPPV